MASPAAIAFHNANAASERERVMLRIANGTKASSNKIIGYRHTHRSFNGISTSNPSGQTLMFKNKNDRDAPFASEMIGGVIKDFRAAQKLLKQRAVSSAAIQAEKEGMEPPAAPLLELSEAESKSLELNNLLQQLQDAVEAGSVSQTMLPDLKNILRLFVSLLPTFTEKEMTELQQFFNDIIVILDTRMEEEALSAPESQVLNFLNKLHSTIREFAPSVTKSVEEKSAVAREVVKRIFKIDFKKLASAGPAAPTPAAPPGGVGAVMGGPLDAEQIAAATRAFYASYEGLPTMSAKGQILSALNEIMTAETERLKRAGDKDGMVAIYNRVLERPRADIADEKITTIKQRILSNYRGASAERRFSLLLRTERPEIIDAAGRIMDEVQARGLAEGAAEA